MDYLKLVQEKLSVEGITEQVKSPSCGAVSVFIGTTRDNFEGKSVVTLEYEAYEPMAVKALKEICANIRKEWPRIENIAIYHRLGQVPVKEASIIIAISSPHRLDAMKATEFCINNVKANVPIWKKEIYANGTPEWKENKESENRSCKKVFDVKQEVKVPFVPSHLIQVKASNDELDQRIQKFIDRKREEINSANIRDFCVKRKFDDEDSCARIDTVLVKRKDSKGHLQVNRVLNTYHRDQMNSDYLMKHIPKNGIEERLQNLESQLNLEKPIPVNIYKRLKLLEDRQLYLESISPEYIHFWEKSGSVHKSVRKRVFTVEEIDGFIADLEKQKVLS